MVENPTGAEQSPRAGPDALCANPMAHPPVVHNLLVIRLSALGDVVRTLPAVSALRGAYPEARITWLVEPVPGTMLAGQPWIDEVLIFPRTELSALLRRGRLFAFGKRLREFLRGLRGRGFDAVVDFHSILKSGMLSKASGALLRIGYAPPFGREGAWCFATHRARLRLPTRRAKLPRFQRNLALVRFLGIAAEPSERPLRLLPEAEARIAAALGQEAESPVAIHPGTSDQTPYKRYTVEGYAAVARALRERYGLCCIVTVGPAADDRAFAEAIVSASAGAAQLAPATPSLADLAALFARCRIYMGSDTGPMHVASLVGTPVVQLLGPTDPVENAPYPGTPSRTLRVPQPCSPCRRGCVPATCMKAIDPEDICRAVAQLLELAERGPDVLNSTDRLET